jgi:hypothetical protein
MMLHILRAALQWALFLPLRVALILLGFLVVPLALPFLTFEGPSIAFTEAPGNWRQARLPAWAWLWSNDRDGALGDERGWWHLNAPFGLGAYHWFSQFWWLAIRNPANNMRFTPWFSCPLAECAFRYWGDESIKDRPGQGGQRLLLATHKTNGRRYYGFYGVWQWSAARALVIQLGFKPEPSDWGDDYSNDPSAQWKGLTFEINPWKSI